MPVYDRLALEQILIAVSELLRSTAPRHALIGGVAVMYYASRAYTQDVDFLVAYGPGEKERLAQLAQDKGWTVERKGPWHLRIHCFGTFADLVDAEVPLQIGAADDARAIETATGVVRITPVEHLVALKVLADRPRDRADIAIIADECADIDVAKVNELLAPFGESWSPRDWSGSCAVG